MLLHLCMLLCLTLADHNVDQTTDHTMDHTTDNTKDTPTTHHRDKPTDLKSLAQNRHPTDNLHKLQNTDQTKSQTMAEGQNYQAEETMRGTIDKKGKEQEGGESKENLELLAGQCQMISSIQNSVIQVMTSHYEFEKGIHSLHSMLDQTNQDIGDLKGHSLCYTV